MGAVNAYLADASTLAFLALGVAVAAGWLRRRDRSVLWLAVAIVALAVVSVVSRITSFAPAVSPVTTQVTILAFVVSAYGLLRYRASLVPLARPWHVGAMAAMVLATAGFVAAEVVVANHSEARRLETGAAIALLLIWSAVVAEAAVRFWLLARRLPPVQAWRLRSLSLGFAGIVAVLIVAIAGGAVVRNPVAQLAIQLVVISIVPLLYVSFSPPAWLRREWRSAEEQGLRLFMEDLLVSDDRDGLARRAAEWATRLVGGEAAAIFGGDGKSRTSTGLDAAELADLAARLDSMPEGVNRVQFGGADRAALRLRLNVMSSAGTLIVLAGPFTPWFGTEDVARVQQVMSAYATAVDRGQLIDRLKESNLRLIEANKHKSVFLASMSHELRTPLNAILGFSELLIDSSNGQFPPETRRRFLEQIHSSGKQLLGLINDILDLSKIEAGQMELRLQPVAIADVVQQVLSTVEPLAAHKSITVSAPDREAGTITADPGKVRQMLLNLVANAVKFTPDGGSVTVRATRLDDTVELSVADNGIGIAAADQQRVFEEFQQVDSGVGRAQSGTGLGLALTRRFAKLHGGDVRVQSELGKGSVFTISLPVEAVVVTPASRLPVLPAATSPDGRPLVLVVEDDPPAAELLCRQIERAGFRTEVARTGGEGLAKARDRRPAAITLDILLPDLDGWEVLTRLKRDEATSQIPVVVVSVVDNPELGIALGALDYFVKPVAPRELMERLARFNFAHRDGSDVTVLVVDDEEANRHWLQRVLEPAGFSVVQASGGREAITLARSRRPDLVLLDLMMPEVTGFDVVEALRAEASTRSIPVMVLTAKTLTEADIRQLNGHVSTILRRGSTGAADLLSLLRQVVTAEPVQA